MPTGDIIRSAGKEYVLGPPLKAGMIGIVYSAINEQEKVAVKVPVPNLSKEGRERFWQEHNVLNELAQNMIGKRFVPWVAKGEFLGRGEEALLLEFVPEETVLTKKFLSLVEQGGLEGEKLALQAAVQYARLLEHLHSLNYTCPDRKLADIRWLDKDERLVVLDWNVVETGTAGRANDLYLFGSLWYQLLAGRYPSPYLNPLDDSSWRDGQITYGTRRLLIEVLAGGYATADELRTAVHERLELLEQDVRGEAQSLYAQYIQPTAGTQVDLEKEWEALDKLDLATRQGHLLENKRNKALDWVRKQGDRLIAAIKQAFLTTRYDEGETAVKEASHLVRSRQDTALQLRVARWRTVIAAGQTAISEAMRLRQDAETIAGIIELLENSVADNTDRWQDAASSIKRKLLAIGQNPEQPQKETHRQIADFYREAQVWQHLQSAEANHYSGSYEQAISDIKSANRWLQAMVAYQRELESWLPNLNQRQKEYEQSQKNKQARQEWDRQTDIGSVVGQPGKIGEMLSRLLELATHVNDVRLVEGKKEALDQLATLYRLTAYARLNPHFWPDALRALSVALQNSELKLSLHQEAIKILQDSYREANILAGWRSQPADQLAAEIYTKGLAIQRSLN